MTKRHRTSILSTIALEGFDYTFVEFSSFKNVKDKRFHKARRAYLKARKDLARMVGCED